MRVIVTRPVAQATAWVESLAAHGVDAVALPLMQICGPLDGEPIASAWQQLGTRRLVFFVSANAVEHFFAMRPADLAWPLGVRAGSTGPGTTAALRAGGLTAAQIVEPASDSAQFDSETLWQQRLQLIDWQGASVQIVRGEGGREWLADTLRENGATVDFVAAYRRTEPDWNTSARSLLAEALAAPTDHLWLFSSSESVEHLTRHLAQRDPPLALPSGARALVTHPRIASAARRAGFSSVRLVRPGLADMVASLQSSSS